MDLIDAISEDEQRKAVRFAYGLDGVKKETATQRRSEALLDIRVSLRTLDRREVSGLKDLTRIVIEQSPHLTQRERTEEVDHMTSDAKRINDLEFAVSYLGRFLAWC